MESRKTRSTSKLLELCNLHQTPSTKQNLRNHQQLKNIFLHNSSQVPSPLSLFLFSHNLRAILEHHSPLHNFLHECSSSNARKFVRCLQAFLKKICAEIPALLNEYFLYLSFIHRRTAFINPFFCCRSIFWSEFSYEYSRYLPTIAPTINIKNSVCWFFPSRRRRRASCSARKISTHDFKRFLRVFWAQKKGKIKFIHTAAVPEALKAI